MPFYAPVDHLFVFSGKLSSQILSPFLKGFFLFLSCMSSLCILDVNSLIKYMICKYFLLLHRLPFHFVGFLCCAEAF